MSARTATKVLLLFILFLPAYAAGAGLGELRLSLIEGDVQIRTADTSEWSPAIINFPLKDGDQLWVPEDGLAEVESRRGTVIRLDERTALDILTVDNDALQFYLDMGLAYVNAKGERDTTLQIDTPLSSIRVYKRAKFSADVSNDGETDISVYLGTISAESRNGETMVRAGKMLSLDESSADLSPLGSADAWERWNQNQDRIIEERSRSTRYLPEELAGYSRDFDNNGEWVDMPLYGFVWRPTVQVTVGWSPYRNGRWVWIGDDYVWIAQESWGWAPYHYGRWSFVPRHGWCWVPPPRNEVYWGPGYVGWVRTATYVAWVPLAPREIYYGHGNYGPHSVDINHIDVNKVVINNVYQNVSIKNSVTIVHNDTFIRGKQVDFNVKGNPFLKEKISVGRPQIEPERATRRASVREIPKAKEPPDKVKETRVEERKEQRRLVRKQDQSVFSPKTAPQTMTVEEKKEPRPKLQRRERLKEEKTQKTAPRKMEEAQPEPSTPPTESRREDKQRLREDKQSTRDKDGSRTNRQATQPPASSEETQPTPAVTEEKAKEEDKNEPRPRNQRKSTMKEEKTREKTPRKMEEAQPPTPAVTEEGAKDKKAPSPSFMAPQAKPEVDNREPRPKKMEKAQPPPAVTDEEQKEKDEDEEATPGHKKKVRKGQPPETEVLPEKLNE